MKLHCTLHPRCELGERFGHKRKVLRMVEVGGELVGEHVVEGFPGMAGPSFAQTPLGHGPIHNDAAVPSIGDDRGRFDRPLERRGDDGCMEREALGALLDLVPTGA